MGVRLYEGDKNEKGGAGIEITPNKIVNLLLRAENNLIQIDDNNDVFTDLQLVEGLKKSDVTPVGVCVGRVLKADGWEYTGTLLSAKTTSGNYIEWLYSDEGKVYVNNGGDTFNQIYLASEVDALFDALATVAKTGDYNDLLNLPVLGTASALDYGNQAGNVVVLGADGKIDSSLVPSTGVMSTYTVENKSDLTSLSQAKKGDIGVVTSENTTYILSNEPYTDIDNWVELQFPTGGVSSVNGKSGAVTLYTGDILESGNKLYVTSQEKQKINQGYEKINDLKTVAFTGSYSDLTNKPTIPSGQIQADWNQNSENEVDYIKNKPTIPVVDTTLGNSNNAISNSAVNNAVNTINSNMSDLNGSVTSISGDLDTVEGDVNSLKGKVSTNEEDITNLTTRVSNIESSESSKQDKLVSGQNIKTIGGQSILGGGNIDISSMISVRVIASDSSQLMYSGGGGGSKTFDIFTPTKSGTYTIICMGRGEQGATGTIAGTTFSIPGGDSYDNYSLCCCSFYAVAGQKVTLTLYAGGSSGTVYKCGVRGYVILGN